MKQESSKKPKGRYRAVAIWLIVLLLCTWIVPAVSSEDFIYGTIAIDKKIITYSTIKSPDLKLFACIYGTPWIILESDANPVEIRPGMSSSITIKAINESGDLVPSADITVSGSTGSSLSKTSGKTTTAGRFVTTFTAQKIGNYVVTASVSKTGYCGSSITQQIIVDSNPPQGQFVADPPSSQAVPNMSVTFDGSASTGADPATKIENWSWNFGDGKTGFGKTVQHSYTKKGTYSVILTVTDQYGKTSNAPVLTYVVSAPVTITTVPVRNETTTKPVTGTTTPGDNATQSGNETPTPPPVPGIPWELIAAILIILLIVVIILAYLWTRSKFLLKPKAKEAPADGQSAVPIRIQFVNGFGWLKKQRSDREVHMEATAGQIQDVVIPAGKEYVDASLTAPRECGLVTVTASTEDKAKATTEVRFTADEADIEVEITPAEIPADGSSTATIILRVRDRNGMHLSYLDEKVIGLTTTLGTVPGIVKIEPKAPSGTAMIMSGTMKGTALVRARTGSVAGEGRVQFREVGKRYCMHCGKQMEMEAPACPSCGRIPPSGVDTKQCSTCNTVLPQPALYCDKCGARQPR